MTPARTGPCATTPKSAPKSAAKPALGSALCHFALLAVCGLPLSAATLPNGFSEFAITDTISSGTAMEFAPDGKLFVLEQAGRIQVYEGSGARNWKQVAPNENFFDADPLTVNSIGERGLLGIAFDPNYASNRFLYVYYTTTGPIHNRISRFTADADGIAVVKASEVVIMDLETLTTTIHNGGAMHFAPAGRLFVAVGDNADGSSSQSINTRLGKILRLDVNNPPTFIAADNPTSIDGIAGTTTGVNRAIWAAGLRNPYTFAFKPGSALMYINDVGAGAWEEVNVGSPGANYGWSNVKGPFLPRTFPDFTPPIVSYQHDGGTNNVPPGPTYTGSAIAGGAFYVSAHPAFPAAYLNDYFFADYVEGWIKRYDSTSNNVINFASNAGGPVDLKVGSDGALYYLARDNGQVYRIAPPTDCPANIVNTGTSVNRVDVDDLLAVINTWGPCPAPPAACAANIVNTGTSANRVDVDDLLAVISSWGPCA